MSGVSISLATIVSDDIVGLSDFYAKTFGFAEVMELRSDIFRGLDVAGLTLGFSAPVVYEMLHIDEWADATGTKQYLTFELDSDEAVAAATSTAVANGAELRHEPYVTYYDAYQSVLADPEGNVFRINHFH
jgi:uncharacterized glyoxalase superfamily protein PhnB